MNVSLLNNTKSAQDISLRNKLISNFLQPQGEREILLQ